MAGNCWKLLGMAEIFRNSWIFWKCLDMARTGWKLLEMEGTAGNGWKLIKMIMMMLENQIEWHYYSYAKVHLYYKKTNPFWHIPAPLGLFSFEERPTPLIPCSLKNAVFVKNPSVRAGLHTIKKVHFNVTFAHTDRFIRSPILTMQRLLNQDHEDNL